MGPLQERCIQQLTEWFGHRDGTSDEIGKWFVPDDRGCEERFSLDPAPGMELRPEPAWSAPGELSAHVVGLFGPALGSPDAVLVVATSRSCRSGDWCAPDRISSEPLHELLAKHAVGVEVSITSRNITRVEDGELEVWGHAHELELFATVEVSEVGPVLRGLAAHQSEGWGEAWLTSVVAPETGVLLRETTSKREMRALAPSPAAIDALRLAHPEWLVGHNVRVVCTVAGLKRTGAVPFVSGMQFAPAHGTRRLREHVREALERNGWSDLKHLGERWPSVDQIEIVFRATVPESWFGFVVHVAPPPTNTKRAGAAAGWYPDPYVFHERHWDGERWTAAVKDRLGTEQVDERWLPD